MKNKFYILSLCLLSVFTIVFILRFIVGGDEDSWLCEDNQWVKHGQPSYDHPSSGCGEDKLIGGDKDKHDCLIAAGYSWCQEKEKCLREWEEPCIQEKAFEYLSKVKNDTNLSFSGIGNTSFTWNFLTSESKGDGNPLEKEIQGKEINLENTESKVAEEIENYFQKENFKIDSFNLADGTIISKQGYKKDNLVCIITRSLVDSNQGDNINNINIKIECSDITNIDFL